MDDLISRKTVLKAINNMVKECDSVYVTSALRNLEVIVADVPSAQPETHEECTETHACDCISRKASIDADGLDEEIRCEMCENPMHTDRGCDGNCKYDEILYEKIIQILNKRITPLPSAQPEIVRCKDCTFYRSDGCFFSTAEIEEDGFCSWAERRTDVDVIT